VLCKVRPIHVEVWSFATTASTSCYPTISANCKTTAEAAVAATARNACANRTARIWLLMCILHELN
jgi:hypothetical protein